MSPVNLQKLLYESPGISPAKVQKALNSVFEDTIVEARNEPFFTFQIRCEDADHKTRLIVRYGWSDNHSRWFFESLPAPNTNGDI